MGGRKRGGVGEGAGAIHGVPAEQAATKLDSAIWKLVKLARRHGVHRTASALTLDYHSLNKRVEQGAATGTR